MRKEEAAQFIGVSVRTLQRLTTKGEIPVTYEDGKKGKEAHYEEADLLDYIQKNKPAAIFRPAATSAMTHDATTVAPLVAPSDVTRGMVEAFNAMAAPVRLSERLLLSLPEASTLSGVPLAKLRSDAKSGALKTIKSVGRGLGKVRRDDLESYVKKLK